MRIILLGVLFFIAIISQAQQSDRAKNILDEVSKKTQSYSSISADFIYTMQNPEEDIDEGYSGSILLKGDKYIVQIDELGLRMFSDSKTIWTYMVDANEVTISSVDEESTELLDPSKVFTIYEKGFKYNFTGEKVEDGINLYLIDLIPETDDQDFTKISIGINKANMMIHFALMFDSVGSQYSIKVRKIETNKVIDDSKFTFDQSKYEDIEVIDFR
jgi:outer membrane lipoprotein-sorting protein